MAYVNVNGTNGNNIMSFVGIVGFYDETLINPYTGFTVTITGTKSVNNAIYNGLGGTDTLTMTSLGDVLHLVDANGTIMVQNVEIIQANDGGDVLNFAHATVTYGNITLRGGNGDDLIWGNIGNDLLQGGAGNDIMDGGAGNDQLFGGDGDDYIHGGLGSDVLGGGAGNDTFVYNADGVWSGGYTLASLGSSIPFAALINLDGMNRSLDTFNGDVSDILEVPTVGYDTLVMTSGNDVLVISDTVSQYNSAYTPRVSYMEEIQAGDGDDIVDLSGAGHQSVIIDGGAGNDILAGSTGDDTIIGGAGNDRIIGGAGNDTLKGGEGDEIYYYSIGQGSDTIIETSGTDAIVFGPGITAEDMVLAADGSNLTITLGSDVITIQNHYAADLSGRVETIMFADNSTFDLGSWVPNVAPVANNDVFNGNEDEIITGNVLTNDTDSAEDTLTVAGGTFTTANGGTVTLNTDGTFSYLGAENFNGEDSFDYTVNDNRGGSATATVTIGVAAMNDAPVAGDDVFSGFRNETISGNLLGNDADLDGDTLFAQAGTIATANGGMVVLANDGNFTYTPKAGFYGSDSFDYTLLDGQGGSDTGTVSLSVALPSDAIAGTDDAETIHGTMGDDRIFGLDGDDILYGDDGSLIGITKDKDFSDNIVIPDLKERINIANLKPPGTAALGISAGNLSIDYDATATLTFRKGGAGYNNTLGSYAIAEDGTIVNAMVYWANVKDAGVDTAHTVDLPTGANGGNYGFFIIADGHTANAGYPGLNLTGEGNIQFIYNYGKVDARPAKITDAGAKISIVYNDGATVKVLSGNKYFTTDRGEAATINKDGQVHVVSGLLDKNNIVMDIKKAEITTTTTSITKDGITLSTLSGVLVAAADNKIGIKSTVSGGNLISGAEKLHAGFDASEKVVVSLADIAGNGTTMIFKIYLDGALSPVTYTHTFGAVTGGKEDILLDSASFGGALITGFDISSATETFYLTGIKAFVPGGVENDTLRIGFEDLYGIGDGDYEDVLFDLDINESYTQHAGGNDLLDGGAGNDILYGEGGNDILVIGLGRDQAYGGEGADTFAITLVDALVDIIHDFSAAEGDKINVADVLQGYDPLSDDIANFIRFTQSGSDTILEINADGAGSDFAAAALIVGGTNGVDVAAMIANGSLVADHSALA